MTAATAGPVEEFATGLRTTRVRRTPDGRHEWWHGPGTDRDGPPAAPLAAAVPAHTAGARLVVPRPSEGGLSYLADGPYSAAAWLRDPRPAVRLLLAHALAGAGQALRDLHAGAVPDGADVPPALARLRSFLDRGAEGTADGPHAPAAVPYAPAAAPYASDGVPYAPATVPHASDGVPYAPATVPYASDAVPHASDGVPYAPATVPHASDAVPHATATAPYAPATASYPPATAPHEPAVARLREHAVRTWGAARVGRLRSWCAELTEPGGAVLVHGFASLGALIPPLRRGPVALLTGEDLGAARPELDLGWLLGDLAELDWALPVPAHPDGPELPRVLLDAYGPGADRELTGRAAVVRVAAHMRDFAAYCGWSDELADYTAFIADLIDEEGRRAVLGGATP
ncbi:hypothetical protein [Streptomyces sp. AC602_WCS936]|uniref:hypothetical protein n=1 Tax=Streptomyces sp. AC602_WCS936 TaxID=2823685 RepID=UPI001C26A52A|nr:hypothetical protein [Streptomyces sp. AC602_WCS936]